MHNVYSVHRARVGRSQDEGSSLQSTAPQLGAQGSGSQKPGPLGSKHLSVGKGVRFTPPGSPFKGGPRRKCGLESLRVLRIQGPSREFSVDSLKPVISESNICDYIINRKGS